LEHNKQKYISFIPALIWAGIIVFMSLLPSEKLPVDVLVVSDKIIHALIYFILTSLLILASIYTSNDVSNLIINKKFIIVSLISLLLGILIEFAQEYMNIGRSGDWKDVIANLFGTVIVYPFTKTMQSSGILKRIM
jgi:VanZ family protein